MDDVQVPAVDLSNVQSGWVVYTADDQKVGEVREVHDTYLVVRQGLIMGKWLYPPLSAVGRAERGSVYLTVSNQELETRGWDEQPEAPELEGAAAVRARIPDSVGTPASASTTDEGRPATSSA